MALATKGWLDQPLTLSSATTGRTGTRISPDSAWGFGVYDTASGADALYIGSNAYPSNLWAVQVKNSETAEGVMFSGWYIVVLTEAIVWPLGYVLCKAPLLNQVL
jgi:hypothetical protein